MSTQSTIRMMVRGTYDLQMLRIQMGNRIVANYRARLGVEPGQKEEEMEDKEGEKILKKIRATYDKMMDGLKGKRMTAKKFTGNELISDYTEMALMEQYVGMEDREKNQFLMLGDAIKEHAIWNEYLVDVKGIGPAIAGVLISEIDIHKSEYPTSIWRLAGLDVADDGRGRGRFKEHLVPYEYQDKDGKPQTRMGISFNPFLKTKLMGVAAASFLKQVGSQYRAIYDNYKNRIDHMPKHMQYYVVETKDGKHRAEFNNVDMPVEDGSKLTKFMAAHWSDDHTKYKPADLLLHHRFYTVSTTDGLYKAEYSNRNVPKAKMEDLRSHMAKLWSKGGSKTYHSSDIVVEMKGKTKGHRHMMAQRYMIKMFLQDLYNNWREIEGLPVAPSYAEAKLGLVHGSAEGKDDFLKRHTEFIGRNPNYVGAREEFQMNEEGPTGADPVETHFGANGPAGPVESKGSIRIDRTEQL